MMFFSIRIYLFPKGCLLLSNCQYYWVLLLSRFALMICFVSHQGWILNALWRVVCEATLPDILLLSRHPRTWQMKSWKKLANIEHKILSTNCHFYFGSKWPCIFRSQLFTNYFWDRKLEIPIETKTLWIISSNFRQFCSKPLISCLFFVFSSTFPSLLLLLSSPFQNFSTWKNGLFKNAWIWMFCFYYYHHNKGIVTVKTSSTY